MSKAKMLAVATMVSLSALSMVACSSEVEGVKIESDKQATGIGEYKGDKEVATGANKESQTFANGYTVQFTDPSKANYRVPGYALDKNGNYDEKTWEKGPNGYKEPPKEIRDYYNPDRPERYRINYYDKEQGELTVIYSENSRNVKSGDVNLAKNSNSKDTIDDILQFVNAMDRGGKSNN